MAEYGLSESFKDNIQREMDDNPFAVLSKLIYDGLYNEIIEGRLHANDKIIESQIAKELNISRTPVKMALNKLIDEGVIEKGKGKELHVKKITYEECLWLYESRLAIEGEAAYFAARRINRKELAMLKEMTCKFKEIDKSHDNKEYVKCDKLFHETIIAASRNKYIIGMYKSIECPLQRYRYQTLQLAYENLYEKNGLERGSNYHLLIYRALYNHMPLVARDEIMNDIKRMYGTMHMLKFL